MKNIVLKTGIILFTLGAFFSCKMGPAYKTVEPDIPETYRFQTDTLDRGDIEWWKLFDDPVLDTLIRASLEQNKNILAVAKNVEIAGLLYNNQKSQMYPQLNVMGSAQRGNYFSTPLESPVNSFFGGITANWEIDFWGKYRRLNEAAKAEFMASSYNLRSLQLSLITSVASAYFQLLQFRASLDISIKTLSLRDSTYNLMSERYKAGIIPEIDLHQAAIQKAIAEGSVPFYERLVAQTENVLSVLTGVEPREIKTERNYESYNVFPDIPVGMPADLLERRPDILRDEQIIIAENARIGVAQALKLPSVSLSGLLGLAGTEFSEIGEGGASWNVGGSITGPLFHWKQNIRRVQIATANTEIAVLNYENTVLNALNEVEDALIQIETLRKEYKAKEDHVKAALGALYLSAERYDKGVTSYLEYLEAQRQSFEAQLGLVGIKQEWIASYIFLYKALGGGWLNEGEMNTDDE